MKTKISIVTPSYNQGHFLRRTLDSIIEQNVEGLELIVFDGGSTDDSVEILESYGDKLFYTSEKDEGQSDAVNKGFTRASGEIIGWLNSDDIYYPNALNSVLEVFEKYPEVDVIYGKADHIDESDKYMEDYYTEKWDYERLKEVCYICQPVVFFRKSVIEQYGGLNKDLNYCMDYEFWLRIGKDKPFYYLEQKLAGSRLYVENKTLGNRVAVHKEIISMIKEKFKTVPERWIYNLAHVLAEEEGLTRTNGTENYKFVRTMVKKSAFLFFIYQKHIPIRQFKEMMSWLRHAKRMASEEAR